MISTTVEVLWSILTFSINDGFNVSVQLPQPPPPKPHTHPPIPSALFWWSTSSCSVLVLIAKDRSPLGLCVMCWVCSWRRWGRVSRHAGTLRDWSDIRGRWCRVGSADPRRLSGGYISDGRFGFSWAPPVSGQKSCDLLPLQWVQIPKEKVKGSPWQSWGHPADTGAALKEPLADTVMCILLGGVPGFFSFSVQL